MRRLQERLLPRIYHVCMYIVNEIYGSTLRKYAQHPLSGPPFKSVYQRYLPVRYLVLPDPPNSGAAIHLAQPDSPPCTVHSCSSEVRPLLPISGCGMSPSECGSDSRGHFDLLVLQSCREIHIFQLGNVQEVFIKIKYNSSRQNGNDATDTMRFIPSARSEPFNFFTPGMIMPGRYIIVNERLHRMQGIATCFRPFSWNAKEVAHMG